MQPRRGGMFEEVAVDPCYGLVCGRPTEVEGKVSERDVRVAY
jgi:hypothetical protein